MSKQPPISGSDNSEPRPTSPLPSSSDEGTSGAPDVDEEEEGNEKEETSQAGSTSNSTHSQNSNPGRGLSPSMAEEVGDAELVDLLSPTEPEPEPEPKHDVDVTVVNTTPATGSSSPSTGASVNRNHQNDSLLLNLPLDVLTLIFETCDWPTAVTLRRTCRQFRHTFPVAHTIRKAKVYRQLLADRDDGSYPAPCYACLRILPKDRFPGGWPGIAGEPLGRRCTGCALAGDLLPRGAHYVWKGSAMLLCSKCGKHRRESGRLAPDDPRDFCPRCRRYRGVWMWLGNRRSSASFYAVIFCLGILTLTAFTFRALIILWPVLPNGDSTIQDFALFTAIYQSMIQLFWLAVFTMARYLPTQNPWRRRAFKIVTGGGIAAETFVEFICLLVSCCLPFSMAHFVSVRVIAWATITWCVASFGAIVRMIAEDDLKRP